MCQFHRYLMSRLSLHVFYLGRHALSTAPPFILWWSNLEILYAPLHRSSPFIERLRCQAIQTEHGPYIAERTQKAVCIVTCLWPILVWPWIRSHILLDPYPMKKLPSCCNTEPEPQLQLWLLLQTYFFYCLIMYIQLAHFYTHLQQISQILCTQCTVSF
jgi:hypothetical protein